MENPRRSYKDERQRLIAYDPDPPCQADTVYLVTEFPDNEWSNLQRAIQLWKDGKTKTITLMDAETHHGYAGFLRWQNFLITRGVPEHEIIILHMPYEISLNTYSEMRIFIKNASEYKWRFVYIVAPLSTRIARLSLV